MRPLPCGVYLGLNGKRSAWRSTKTGRHAGFMTRSYPGKRLILFSTDADLHWPLRCSVSNVGYGFYLMESGRNGSVSNDLESNLVLSFYRLFSKAKSPTLTVPCTRGLIPRLGMRHDRVLRCPLTNTMWGAHSNTRFHFTLITHTQYGDLFAWPGLLAHSLRACTHVDLRGRVHVTAVASTTCTEAPCP